METCERDYKLKDRENYLKGAEAMRKAVVKLNIMTPFERGEMFNGEEYVCGILNRYSPDVILRSIGES